MPQTLLDFRVAVPHDTKLRRSTLLSLAALTPAVLLVHGYHPFADDAGIYVAGIRKLVDPKLYQVDAPFVVTHTHFSIFAHVLAEVARMTHLPLAIVLLATYLVSVYAYLLAGWMVASRLFSREAERWFAVGFAAACFTLPAAGTALMLMDPYVTSRSLSTPFGLFALAAVLGRRWGWAAALIVATGLLHPLMAVYAAGLVLLYAVEDRYGLRAMAITGAAGVAVTGVIWAATRLAPVSAAYFEAMHSSVREYLFPMEWRWYEDLGLVIPVLLLAMGAWRARTDGRISKLCAACAALGVSSAAAAFLFVHTTGPYFLVRLQMLRSFQTVYLAGVLLLGGWLGGVLWYRRKTRWVAFALLAAAAGGLFAAERAAYPDSAHIEWPGVQPRNLWAQAYWWIRGNTPEEAVFASDPNLMFQDGVDAQGFRATAKRSLLADDKDQAIAAVVNPSIVEVWAKQRDAQIGINTMSDAERIEKLKPLGVTWLLLRADAKTDLPCPYENAAAKVCVLAARAHAPSTPL